MPRCLMAKKWKAYHWPKSSDQNSEEKLQPIKEVVKLESAEEDEEIDVVGNGYSDPKSEFTSDQKLESTNQMPVVEYKESNSSLVRRQSSNTPGLPPILPPGLPGLQPIFQGYYRPGPDEEYQNPIPPKLEQDNIQDTSEDTLSPSVIQHHSSTPTSPQVRYTSVILHSSSLLPENSVIAANSSSAANRQLTNSNLNPTPSTWGPSSPTEGETAPSPPLHIQHSSQSETKTGNFIGYASSNSDISRYSAYLPGENSSSPPYAAANNNQSPPAQYPVTSDQPPRPQPVRTRSLAMCFTSTGAALSLPPKKKDIYRPYSLDDRPPPQMRWRPAEDLTAAHAILDLSASPPAPPPQQILHHQNSSPPLRTPIPTTCPTPAPAPSPIPVLPLKPTKTVSYTYEAFFVSDGRSKKKLAVNPENVSEAELKPKYTCSECGKQYATSSNLSRHKQTHRSLDSQSAKKCVTCGKAYVSMPALAMHLLTHKLNHACGICGKLFSRPWLLQGHLRSHTGEKPYGCAHCGKAFADRSNLRAHMQTHSADKNFECTRCHKSFALKSYLNKHLESACIPDNETRGTIIVSASHPPPHVTTITHLR